jgi:hypothetical protein
MEYEDFYNTLQERIGELPSRTREIVEGTDWFQKTLDSIESFELSKEANQRVAQEVMMVVVGLNKRDGFEKSLNDIPGVPEEFVYEIIQIVDDAIFAELNRQYLEKTDPEALEVPDENIVERDKQTERESDSLDEIPQDISKEVATPVVKKISQNEQTQATEGNLTPKDDPYHEEITPEDLEFNPSFRVEEPESEVLFQNSEKMSIPEYKRVRPLGVKESQRTLTDSDLNT